MFNYDVLCVGSATVDNFLTVDQSLKGIKLGDKVLVKSREIHSGGGASNSAAALSKLELKAKILTKLGHDHDADFILKELQQYKVKNICKHRSQKSTDNATIISSTKERDRIIYVYKGASQELNSADFNKSQLKSRWIYLATLMGKSLQTAKEIAQYAEKNNISVLFNPSLYLAKKGKAYLKPFLQATTALVLNKEEAQAILNKKNNTKELLLGLSALGPKIVVITDGPKKLFALAENK
ncbi:MAG: carbohydrate kinase family protein, partial [Candidatus Woesearchaeota archaeon]